MSTLLRVTSVLVLAASVVACSGGDSKGTSDAGSDGGDAGGDNTANSGDPDGGDNTPGSNGDGGNNNGVDGGTNGVDGGTNGVDGGMNTGVAFACPNAATSVGAAGGQVTSDDGLLTLSLSAGALAQDANIKVCAVPQDKRPAQVVADGAGPVAAVYQIEPPTLTFAADVRANLTIQGAPLTAITSADGIAPLTFHRLPNTGAIARLNDVTMELATQPILRGELDGAGHIYARHVDSAGARYAVQVATSAGALTKLTGETFDLGTKVTVVGTPMTATRTLALVTRGCDLEPLQPSGVRQPLTQEGGCEVDAVLRTGAQLTANGDVLAAGAVIDLTAGGNTTHPPPRFFCTFPGAAKAGVRLQFGVGAEREVTVIAEQDVTCTPSGDRVSFYDVLPARRLLHGPIVPTLSPRGVTLSGPDVQLMTPAARGTALGADGLLYPEPAGRSLETIEALAAFTLRGPGNFAPMVYDDQLLPTAFYRPVDTFNQDLELMPAPGGELLLENAGGETLLSVDGVDRTAMDVRFDTAVKTNPAILFADDQVDLVLVSRRNSTNRIVFERWVRASSLPLEGGRRKLRAYTSEQALHFGATSFASLDFGFFKVEWDAERAFATAGRITPLMAGFAIRITEAALKSEPLESPCVAMQASATTCTAGPNEFLAVATETNVELFDPIDGHYVRTLIDGGTLGAEGFRQVVQGPDGCLYASQQDNGANGDGIWRYNTNGTGLALQNAPYITLAQKGTSLITAFTPRGLTFVDGDLMVANEAGGVLRFDVSTPANGTWLVDYLSVASYTPNSVFLAATGGAGRFYTTDIEAAAGSQKWVESDPPANPTDAASGIVDRVSVLSNPQQITTDAGALRDVLIANAGTHEVLLYDRAVPNALPQTPTRAISFGSQTPQGVHALLNGAWLVAGTDGLDVQTVVPGLVTQPKTLIRDTADAYYISRVCVP